MKRIAERVRGGKCYWPSWKKERNRTCKMGGTLQAVTRFLHFWSDAVSFMAYNGNNITSFLQDFIHFHAELGTFGRFLHDAPGLLWLMADAWQAVGADNARFCRLNRAEPGTLPPRCCCGVLLCAVARGCVVGCRHAGGWMGTAWAGWQWVACGWVMLRYTVVYSTGRETHAHARRAGTHTRRGRTRARI